MIATSRNPLKSTTDLLQLPFKYLKMDHFDFLINMEQISSSKDLDSTEGDDNIEEDNGISAQDLTPFNSDNSDLRISEPRTQDDNTLFETNLSQISANPVNEIEPGDISCVKDLNEDHNNYTVAENPLLSFDLENESTFAQSENSDSWQIEACTSELTNSEFFKDVEIDASNRSESTSSLESNGSTPWVQAVLLTKGTNETGNYAKESTDSLFNNSDSMTAESPGSSEPLTPSVNEGTDEELLRDKSEDLAQVSDAATTPDEIIMDPLDVAFLQQDVWHQNQAFIPILMTEVTTAEEKLDEKSNLDPVVMPMNCEPSSNKIESQETEEVITETSYVISTHDSVSTLPSYIPSVHKELVGWNNQPTETEDTSHFSFGNQSHSKELKLTSSEESLPNFFKPKEALFAGTSQTVYVTSISEAVLFSDNQDISIRGTFRDYADDVCKEQDVSTDAQKTSQTWNSENIKPLLCDCQKTNQLSPMADRENWSPTMDSQIDLHEGQEQVECTLTGKNGADNCSYDNADKNIEGMELGNLSREQDKEENEGITDVITENDAIQSKQQPRPLPETNITKETTDFEALLANGNKPDREVAIRLAYKLYNLDGFKKTDIAPYIEKKYVCCRIISAIMFSFLQN
ncbi:uncharacterized protein LOC127584377 [Pristis pectinata]|uniref:uncharacterized protein LOC127584377 n=1 Tax=Pristis pectinata TaxID=685728 RepID=UPI00223CAC4D|nr:uncharacterized protein LOC127584377 [Pristis pectinata]XP_051897113.1 uncharacterized protein LOC127584377 [Pristis pectinata]XP_051897114.1 uncharacterized protein LOC127584377 [Pristis pectinata]